MGGRLDATNVITPMVSIVTSVSKEHQLYLGETIKEIAGEKAGIIKEGIPVISGVRDKQARGVIKETAKTRNAKLYELQKDFDFTISNRETFDYKGIDRVYKGVRKSLLGEHQFDNFSVALAALEVIEKSGFTVDEKNLRKGLSNVKWDGRFEVFSNKPLLILDGAHNDESMESAVNTLRRNFPGKKVILVIGVMKDKDIGGIIKHISDISHIVILTKPEINRAADTHELAQFFDEKKEVVQIPSVKDAIDHAKKLYNKDSLIFVTCSLFTVGDARKYLTGGN